MIPKFDTQKELFDYLRANKKRIIAEKCFKKKNISCRQLPDTILTVKANTTKAPIEVIELEDGILNKTIIGNTFYWCDSQMDVLLPGCAKKTIAELGPKGKDLIYHLKNHDSDTESRIGYITDIYEKDFALTDLGLNMVGNTTCLLFDTQVKQALCDNSYQQYLDGKVKQHSIGLQYIKILLCVNDPNDQEHFANWNKYYQFVINKPTVDAVGYFWVVPEIKLYEVSFVLWGANELTGVVEETKDNEPSNDTQKDQPSNDTEEAINYIKSKSFFKQK